MFNASYTLGLDGSLLWEPVYIITESSEQSTESDLEFNFRFSV